MLRYYEQGRGEAESAGRGGIGPVQSVARPLTGGGRAKRV